MFLTNESVASSELLLTGEADWVRDAECAGSASSGLLRHGRINTSIAQAAANFSLLENSYLESCEHDQIPESSPIFFPTSVNYYASGVQAPSML
jgi:hypothetical protein